MTYALLGQSLHETADRARQYFAGQYGAKHFYCEQAVEDSLPLKPTWQATLPGKYCLCVEVRESPFSQSLSEFIVRCAQQGLPVKLWVAMPQTAAAPTFNSELKQAREFGVGVLQIADNRATHEFSRPVALSLFALKKTNLRIVPMSRRDEVKSAESTFLDGSPDQGCQAICQALEQVTRRFAYYTHDVGWWKQPGGAAVLNKPFFETKPWAKVLEEMEARIDVAKVRAKSPSFNKQAIVKARGHTDWRNAVSHRPSTFKGLIDRDARLRTMFESTRDILVEWYGIAKPLRLLS
jgi:hypothetical protein